MKYRRIPWCPRLAHIVRQDEGPAPTQLDLFSSLEASLQAGLVTLGSHRPEIAPEDES
ncbi:MAG TPA: hypothetical protein VME66_02975 [Candidatus Acidoferrales bacterium]|nr:hypothetical protein [Candidatus Acidoferrales bacterium]